MMSIAYLDADGWVRQWQEYGEPSEIEGLTADLLPEPMPQRPNMRKVDGAYVDMTPADPQPSDSSELREVNGTLVWVETATLAEQQAAVWERIKDKRDSIKRGGVLVNGSWFHSDDSSRIQQLGLKDQARDMLAAGGTATDVLYKLGYPIQWKTMSGAFVPMTVQLAVDIVAAVGDADARSFAKAEQHRVAMVASANPSAYDYSTGWPQVYADTLQA
jgi:hypothetical protein